MLRYLATVAMLAASGGTLAAASSATPRYPETRKVDVVETTFGETIADPYRWLENDVRTDREVAAWVDAQNRAAQEVLGKMPGRAWFQKRIAEITDYERFGTPEKAGNRYFYTYNPGLANQSKLYVRDGLGGKGRLLIDPSKWAKDGATALSKFDPSKTGKYLSYEVQDGGTDWRIIRVIDVATGKLLGDELRWAKYGGSVAWLGDEGFFYSRFPTTGDKPDYQSLTYNQAVWYHKVGTPQSADRMVFATPENRENGNSIKLDPKGRWAVVSTKLGGDQRYEISKIDLANGSVSKGWKATKIVTGFEDEWRNVGIVGNWVYMRTNAGAPRYRIVKANLAAKTSEWVTVIPETAQSIESATIVGDRLLVNYLNDASTRVGVFTLGGKPLRGLALGRIGTASGFTGTPGDSETFFTFTSFAQPSTVYRLDLKTGAQSVFAQPKLTFDPSRFETSQVFYPSKDGTRIPMFIVRRRDLAGPRPTILYGYGGFDVSQQPGFSAARMAWLEAGGTFVLANLRGGGEYGKAWYDAGRLANKQNVFDDFAWAGKYLKANGYTPSEGLAIEGRSNGGLLVGAVVNQHPELIDAAHAAVGVMDMLRFDRFTSGRTWVSDYGYPSREADFRLLRAYSPYHNLQPGTNYPPVLVSTADTDDRVVPGHSFKYAAALQAADPAGDPHIIRIETRAGHGSGKPTDKAILESADVLSFLAHHTGLEVPPRQ